MSSENNSYTPKLRFPEFTGEWNEIKFKEFTFATGRKNKDNLPYDRYSISNETGFCPQNEQFEGGGGYLKNNDCSKHIIVSPGTFAYNPSRINVGSIGYQNLNKDVIVSPLYEIFKTTNVCNDLFLWHWFHSDNFRMLVIKGQEGGVRLSFTYKKLRECKINLPTLAEQEKIATFLSEIDALISAQDQKVERLKEHKKGLMQQLFPQPGETKPRLRFPEFSGEWEEKTLGSIAKKVNLRNSKMEITRVLTNSANSGIVDQNDYFDRSIAVKENTANYHIVDINEFVYNPRISSAAPVGPISINKIGKGIMSPLYTIFRFHTGCIAFYEQYFQTTIWHPYLKSIANFGARFDRMNITSEGFFNMPLYIPSYAEQRIIADFLSNFDSLISDEEARLESLKDHKKGLMQQLFPTPSK